VRGLNLWPIGWGGKTLKVWQCKIFSTNWEFLSYSFLVKTIFCDSNPVFTTHYMNLFDKLIKHKCHLNTNITDEKSIERTLIKNKT